MKQLGRAIALTVVLLVAWFTFAALAQQAPPQDAPQSPIVSVPGTAPVASPDVASQPAVSVTEVKSPAAPAHYQDQAIWALVVSFLLQYLKKRPWFGWVTPASSARIKTQFGAIAALLTAAGIHFAVSGSIFDDGGAAFTVSGLSFNAIKDVIWQWGAQEGWYRLLVKEPREVSVVAPDRSSVPLGSVSEATRAKLQGGES